MSEFNLLHAGPAQTSPVGPVLAGPIFVRKRGCDNCVLTLAL